MRRVRQILSQHPGPVDVVIVVESADESDPMIGRRVHLGLQGALRVTCSSDLRTQLQGVLGEEHVRFHAAPKKNGRSAESRRPAVAVG
jgi:hypothetical protein